VDAVIFAGVEPERDPRARRTFRNHKLETLDQRLTSSWRTRTGVQNNFFLTLKAALINLGAILETTN
jgi:hypothetical protein